MIRKLIEKGLEFLLSHHFGKKHGCFDKSIDTIVCHFWRQVMMFDLAPSCGLFDVLSFTSVFVYGALRLSTEEFLSQGNNDITIMTNESQLCLLVSRLIVHWAKFPYERVDAKVMTFLFKTQKTGVLEGIQTHLQFLMHPYGWPEYKWYYLYSCRNFLFFFPVWHSEGKTRRILLGFEQKRLYPLMNRIMVTFGENANMRWEKIIIICFLVCHWCINTTKTTTSYFSITISTHGVTGVSFNDLTSIFRAEVICEISI